MDEQGRKPSPTKEEAIRKAPEPTTRLQLQSFLGLINYYRPSIVDMSMVAGPLNKLLSPGVKFVWTKECSAAFEELKKILLSSDVLVHYDVTKPVTLAVDASPYGIGAVISHVLEDGTERPIEFASRSLSSAEKNYSQIEKEGFRWIKSETWHPWGIRARQQAQCGFFQSDFRCLVDGYMIQS